MLLGMRLGAALVLHTRFDVDAVLNEIAAGRITVFPGVPTMYTAMLSHPRAAATDMRSLKFCGSGGAPLPVEVEQRFFAMTGCHLNEGWGMTETSPLPAPSRRRAGARRAGSCGMPLPGIRIKLLALDGSGAEVATGEPGELCVKGPNVMKGYWNNAQANAEAFTADGYFRSGDVAKFDADGLPLHRRPHQGHAAVRRLQRLPARAGGGDLRAPFGGRSLRDRRADEYRGQSPKAFVVLKAGAPPLDLDTLKAFLKNRLGRHEMIGELEVRAELPKTAVGKLSKKDLVEQEAAKRAAAAA